MTAKNKSKLFTLKVLVISLSSLIVISFFVPFDLYRNTLNLVSTHLSRYEDFKKFTYIKNNIADVTTRFDYPIEIFINSVFRVKTILSRRLNAAVVNMFVFEIEETIEKSLLDAIILDKACTISSDSLMHTYFFDA